VTGPNGEGGFVNMTIPKTAVPYGKNPVVYVNGQLAPNQGYVQNSKFFYVWYAMQFNSSLANWSVLGGLQVILQFTVPSTSLASSLVPVLGVGIAVGAVILAFIVWDIKGFRRKPKNTLPSPQN
jgi:hypothetical protein